MTHRWIDEDVQQVKVRRKVKARTMGHTVEVSPQSYTSMQAFFIPGPLPGMNDYISTGSRFIYGNDKKKWQKIIMHAIQQHGIGPMACAWFRFQWREKTKRRDPDNFTSIGKKFIFDTLVESGVMNDDGWEEIIGWEDRWCLDADSPGVYIEMFSRKPGGKS